MSQTNYPHSIRLFICLDCDDFITANDMKFSFLLQQRIFYRLSKDGPFLALLHKWPFVIEIFKAHVSQVNSALKQDGQYCV